MLKVNVLMSTYNGEHYIEEQIDSVLNQTGVEVSLLIRDDGSKDSTVDIIKKYAENNDNVKYYSGDNLGPAKSFLDLCKNTERFDYYAFCDQDDIWDIDKLSVAVNMLEQCDQTKPNLYYSNLRLVDANAQYYRDAHTLPATHEERYMAYVYNIATGCTMVFNNICLDYANSKAVENIYMHDYWLYLICKFFGNTIYDHKPHISYRQHDNNVCGMLLDVERRPIRRKIKNFFKLIFEERNEGLYNTLVEFNRCFGDALPKKDREKLLEIVRYRDSVKDRLKLLFDKEIHHNCLKTDIRYRRRIIQGKIQM